MVVFLQIVSMKAVCLDQEKVFNHPMIHVRSAPVRYNLLAICLSGDQSHDCFTYIDVYFTSISI